MTDLENISLGCTPSICNIQKLINMRDMGCWEKQAKSSGLSTLRKQYFLSISQNDNRITQSNTYFIIVQRQLLRQSCVSLLLLLICSYRPNMHFTLVIWGMTGLNEEFKSWSVLNKHYYLEATPWYSIPCILIFAGDLVRLTGSDSLHKMNSCIWCCVERLL